MKKKSRTHYLNTLLVVLILILTGLLLGKRTDVHKEATEKEGVIIDLPHSHQ